MRHFTKPNVIVSRCLEFAACRYDGQKIQDKFIALLKKHVKFNTVCPEVEIGMGIPRDPIRIVESNGERKLLQPATGKDFSSKMNRYSEKTLKNLDDIDGFILKSRSPSCGISDTKIFGALEKAPSLGKSSGFYGGAVLEKYGHLAVEDEGRLTNYNIRENFLTKLYLLADFREIKKSPTIKKLTTFHANNKYLFMAYNQTRMRTMGRIAANLEKHSLEQVIIDYEQELWLLLARPPRKSSIINSLEHIFGYFKKQLSAKEKRYYATLVAKYREQKIPLSSLQVLLNSWIVEYNQEYLAAQTFFEPFPEELVTVLDSGKGREL